MKTNENIPPEVKQLLYALAEPRANQQRQQQLSEMIDRLAAQEQQHATLPAKRRRVWLWAGMVAAAACLFLFFMRLPIGTVEETLPLDPILVSENKTMEPDTQEIATVLPVRKAVAPRTAKPMLVAEVREPEVDADTETMVTIKTLEPVAAEEEASAIEVMETAPTTPTRRVVACHTLVCYDCKEPRQQKRTKQSEDKTIFGTPSTTNMDGGVLMLAAL